MVTGVAAAAKTPVSPTRDATGAATQNHSASHACQGHTVTGTDVSRATILDAQWRPLCLLAPPPLAFDDVGQDRQDSGGDLFSLYFCFPREPRTWIQSPHLEIFPAKVLCPTLTLRVRHGIEGDCAAVGASGCACDLGRRTHCCCDDPASPYIAVERIAAGGGRLPAAVNGYDRGVCVDELARRKGLSKFRDPLPLQPAVGDGFHPLLARRRCDLELEACRWRRRCAAVPRE